MLAKGWPPQQIAARLKANWPDKTEWQVSHESIYLTIYAYPRGELKRQLIGCLRQGQGKRRGRTMTRNGGSVTPRSRIFVTGQRT